MRSAWDHIPHPNGPPPQSNYPPPSSNYPPSSGNYPPQGGPSGGSAALGALSRLFGGGGGGR